MALIKCRECGKEVSSKADKCPNCGAPVKRKTSGCALIVAVVFGVGLVGTIAPTCSGPSSSAPVAIAVPEPVNRKKIFEDAKAKFETQIAAKYRELVAAKESGNNEAALALVRQFESFRRSDYESVAVIAKEVHSVDALRRLDKTAATDLKKRSEIYAELSGLHPENADYKASAAKLAEEWKQQEAGRIEAERKAAAERERVATRKRVIEQQFSGWDGSHRALEKIIKESMNDPKSYEHVETVYTDAGDYLVVKTTFRGKNAFGGVVKNWVRAKFTLNGDFLGIVDHGP